MESFLYTVAEKILNRNPEDLERVVVVFNNRRAGLFLSNEMARIKQKSFFLPKIIGIDDLVSELGKLQIVQHEFLLFELYDIYANTDKNVRKFDSFEEFMSFGETMLSDFSEIDLYCIDAKQLFNNIYETKKLGIWDISGKPQTSFQESYLNFFQSLHSYYTKLHERLSKKGQAYTGMAYRYVADNIDSLIDDYDCEHIWFVGFNALSTSEQKIIDTFIQRGKGSIIFDGDDYYLEKDNSGRLLQESGLFLNQHKTHYSGDFKFGELFGKEPKEINIIDCPENILQTKCAGNILTELSNKKSSSDEAEGENNTLENTAIILADEKLLLPMLNSLPSNVTKTNVTMGFPFNLTNTYSLIEKILLSYCHRKNDQFYHKDIVSIFSDHMMATILGEHEIHSKIVARLSEDKIIYANHEYIKSLLRILKNGNLIEFLFTEKEPTLDEILQMLKSLTVLISDSLNEKNIKEHEAAECMLQTINYLINLQESHQFIQHVDTLLRIFQRLAQRRTVPFYGEPLRGLQVLGMLETRNINFEKIILLSANEGVLPAGRSDNSLIPLSLKTAFGLPTFRQKDAVYAYHFYRLIQRAKEVYLLYSSDSTVNGKGEPSRFIQQVKTELSERYKNIKIIEETLSASIKTTSKEGITKIPKTERVMEQLKRIAEKGLSPSALNTYRSCPLKFYYEKVMEVRETDEVTEEIESNEIGEFIHDILKDIYSIDNGEIQKTTLQNELKRIDETVDNIFEKKLLKGRSHEGKNHLYNNVIKSQLRHFLKNEIAFWDSHTMNMVMLEDKMIQQIDMSDYGIHYPVNITGRVDRIDRVDNILRVIDYKSGAVSDNDLKVSPTRTKKENDTQGASLAMKAPDKWFQVMTYAWLFFNSKEGKTHNDSNFLTGIFPLRTLKTSFMVASWDGETIHNMETLKKIERLLKEVLSEMLNPAIYFEAAPKSKSCQYCPFNDTCAK